MIPRLCGSRRAGPLVLGVLGLLVWGASASTAEFVTPGEMQRKAAWIKTHLGVPAHGSAVLVRLWRQGVKGTAPGLAEAHGNHADRPHSPAGHGVEGSCDGPAGPLRGGRLRRLSRGGMDGLSQERRRSSHAHSQADPGTGRDARTRAGHAQRVRPALLEGRHFRRGPVSAARAEACGQRRRAVRACGRPG